MSFELEPDALSDMANSKPINVGALLSSVYDTCVASRGVAEPEKFVRNVKLENTLSAIKHPPPALVESRSAKLGAPPDPVPLVGQGTGAARPVEAASKESTRQSEKPRTSFFTFSSVDNAAKTTIAPIAES